MRTRLLVVSWCALALFSAMALLAWKTSRDLLPLPDSLDVGDSEVRKPQVTDRNGRLLSITRLNRWNGEVTPLNELPALLRQAFVESEDRRFHRHAGVDWVARFHAFVQNIRAGHVVRGASTITEQVVRMLHPRPRTFWSRWIEGFEATRLEARFSKPQILEFYINQVPYGHQLRGVAEAARFYFDRDPDTLNEREILALAVLVRAPSSLDLRRNPGALRKGVAGLAGHMLESGLFTDDQYRRAMSGRLELARPANRVVEASHFVQHIFKTAGPELLGSGARIASTLDADLQESVRRILEERLKALASSEVGNGAVLVAESSGEVLAWVSDGAPGPDSGDWIDGVSVPRQPGSTLKPFLYALAMEMGWTPATIIEDLPLVEPVRSGLHEFKNYSRTFYGPLRLREALGNSLNTPAVRTIQFTGTGHFLEWLHLLGISALKEPADFYGQGLALGDGEVSLFELVQAYSVLARGGEFRPLRLVSDSRRLPGASRRIMDAKTASLIADVLSDPQARRLEFGEGHLLRFPVPTAVKTGTSSDHRDSWAVGFSNRYTVGVWMGNFDRRPTRGITGAIGPALVLRSVFAELNRYGESSRLPVASGLERVTICAVSGLIAGPHCPQTSELFETGKVPVETCHIHDCAPKTAAAASSTRAAPPGDGAAGEGPGTLRLVQPVEGLQIAIDPRIPRELQAFAFKLPNAAGASRVEWVLDGKKAGETDVTRFLWPLSRGTHRVKAKVWREGRGDVVETREVSFTVK